MIHFGITVISLRLATTGTKNLTSLILLGAVVSVRVSRRGISLAAVRAKQGLSEQEHSALNGVECNGAQIYLLTLEDYSHGHRIALPDRNLNGSYNARRPRSALS